MAGEVVQFPELKMDSSKTYVVLVGGVFFHSCRRITRTIGEHRAAIAMIAKVPLDDVMIMEHNETV